MIRKIHSKLIMVALIFVLVIGGCARSSGPIPQEPGGPAQTLMPGGEEPVTGTPASPLDPIPGEEKMTRGEAIIQRSEIVLLADNPLHVMLSLKGTLPTPCHHLRASVNEPDKDQRIQVEVYALSNPDEICIQVIQEFDTFLPLGSYPAGTYSVWLNGNKVGEFTQ